MHYYAVIPAAGNGSRFRGDSPKQYWMLRDKPVLLHSIERLAAAISLAKTYVAIAAQDRWFDQAIGANSGATVLRCGGATRGETVRNALTALVDAGDDAWILIHDAVRPCIDSASLLRLRQEPADVPSSSIARCARQSCGGALHRRGPSRRDAGTKAAARYRRSQ
jgi:2-C-methyl-D-erythritol 4-phosphate cytidylyltransferase